MTAMARGEVPDPEVVLVCDRCGTALRARSTPIRDFAIVWSAAVDIGWEGVGRPVGPHRCPNCQTGLDR